MNIMPAKNKIFIRQIKVQRLDWKKEASNKIEITVSISLRLLNFLVIEVIIYVAVFYLYLGLETITANHYVTIRG